jgi:hypothetical protein
VIGCHESVSVLVKRDGLSVWYWLSRGRRVSFSTGLAATHKGYDFQLVAGLQNALIVLFSGQEFLVTFDRAQFGANVQLLQELADR